MQHGLSDSTASKLPRRAPDDITAPGTGLDLLVEMIGGRKRVLDLGCGEGQLAQILSRHECDIVGFDINPAAVEEARKYCTHAGVANIDGSLLPELLGEQRFDVIALNNALQYLRQPTRLLDSARSLLTEGGYVVALIPNVSHGAIRLALLNGEFDIQEEAPGECSLQKFTAKTIDELFLNAGYRIEPFLRVRQPIFGATGHVPHIQREDFDAAIVEEVERDPESETMQFVVRALPLSNDAKHRAIEKRFIIANTQLSTLAARIERRDREIERLAALARNREAELAEMNARLAADNDEMQHARLALVEMVEASRSGAAVISQAAEFEAHARVAEARLRELEARIPSLIERAHSAELEAARLSERLAVQVREDPAFKIELERANAQRDDVLDQLEQAKQQVTTEYARAAAELNARLLKVREGANATEFAYAERIVDMEAALAAKQAEIAAKQAELDAVELDRARESGELERLAQALADARNEFSTENAANAANLHEVGLEIVALRTAVNDRQAELDAANDDLREARSQNDALRAERDISNAEIHSARLRNETSLAERDAANSALMEARAALAALELRATELEGLLDLASEESSSRAEEVEAYATLLVVADEDIANLNQRVGLLEERLRNEEDLKAANAANLHEVGLEIVALRTAVNDRQAELDAANDDLREARSQNDALRAERDISNAEIHSARLRNETFLAERDAANSALVEARAALAALELRATELEGLLDLASEESSGRAEEVEAYATLLVVADEDIANLNQRVGLLEERLRNEEDLKAAIQEIRHENDLLRFKIAEESKRMNEIDRRFVNQTQSLLDQTRAETERTALLIDTVQGSFFWKLKRLFGRKRSA